MPPAAGVAPLGYFLGFSRLTSALKSAPARNLGTEELGTWMVAPVAGLRAVRAGRSLFSKTPNPVRATLSPLATADWMVSSTAFTASVADFLSPSRPEIASIRSRLFMVHSCASPTRRMGSENESATSDLPESRRANAVAQYPRPHWPACRRIHTVVRYRTLTPEVRSVTTLAGP